MAQLKTNCRQIIERGNEIDKHVLNRLSGVYAVSWHKVAQDAPVWGIVVFSEDSQMVRTYNVTVSNKWANGLVSIEHLKFYKPTRMELDFANQYEADMMYRLEYQMAADRLNSYTDSRWHRVAEALRKFFSV